ncbi:PDZ domain-containing protein MAGIX isoform X3 [Oryctolagus cuniculus]|uniref:PDZ domain-containing protein MAGIX isoform X3 n=1 Tax=Oryctolagus cuniculus TaxID=9986 RepID=UPI00222F6B9F|nr:PDZ domain-containing protein MAGIX isoform X3 [Oryctolagus cuniculus]
MEPRAGGAAEPKGSKGGGKHCSSGAQAAVAAGRSFPLPAAPSARQLLARLDARPLAARAAADVSALVRRAGATLRLRPKEADSALNSADIEVTDSRLPHVTNTEHRPQQRRSETLTTGTAPPLVTQGEGRGTSKAPQASDRFSVELVRGSAGFGLTLSGGRDVGGDAPLVVRGLLKDGPAHRSGRLQAGDLVLYVNRESTQGLTHAQVVERIRAGGPRLRLVLCRPLESQPRKVEGMGKSQKGHDCSPDPGGPEVIKSRGCTSASPVQPPPFSTTPKTWSSSSEPSPEVTLPPPERRTEDPEDHIPGSPGPWLVPSQERLSRALGVPAPGQLAQEVAAGRRRH